MATSTKGMSEEEWDLLAGIGAMYKEMRVESGMTQREAAKEAGTSQARVPVLEQGQADVMVTTLQRWAYIYGYKLEVSVVKIEEAEAEALAALQAEEKADGEAA